MQKQKQLVSAGINVEMPAREKLVLETLCSFLSPTGNCSFWHCVISTSQCCYGAGQGLAVRRSRPRLIHVQVGTQSRQNSLGKVLIGCQFFWKETKRLDSLQQCCAVQFPELALSIDARLCNGCRIMVCTDEHMDRPRAEGFQRRIQPTCGFVREDSTKGMTVESIRHVVNYAGVVERGADLTNQRLPIGERLSINASLTARCRNSYYFHLFLVKQFRPARKRRRSPTAVRKAYKPDTWS
mmetsp:Transcript_91813/g.172885  ORF Transcript_91813/g.172885 Transcript_91813/m.172885 type:complete len:240 (-) Transcript_91813:131-850(-)